MPNTAQSTEEATVSKLLVLPSWSLQSNGGNGYLSNNHTHIYIYTNQVWKHKDILFLTRSTGHLQLCIVVCFQASWTPCIITNCVKKQLRRLKGG